MTTATTSLELDADTNERLQRLAEVRRRSQHSLIREAIAQYVDREERREQLRQDALATWTDFQSSGQHVTAEEADLWLGRLEDGEDAAPPEPHG